MDVDALTAAAVAAGFSQRGVYGRHAPIVLRVQVGAVLDEEPDDVVPAPAGGLVERSQAALTVLRVDVGAGRQQKRQRLMRALPESTAEKGKRPTRRLAGAGVSVRNSRLPAGAGIQGSCVVLFLIFLRVSGTLASGWCATRARWHFHKRSTNVLRLRAATVNAYWRDAHGAGFASLTEELSWHMMRF